MTSVERRTRKKLNRDVAGSTIFSERRGNVAHVAEDADVRFHRFHRQWVARREECFLSFGLERERLPHAQICPNTRAWTPKLIQYSTSMTRYEMTGIRLL